MDAPQNSGQNQNGQNNNNNKKPQLSWSQPVNTNNQKNQAKPVQSSTTSTKSSNNTQSHTMRNISIVVVTVLVIGGIVWALSGSKHSSTDADLSMMATTTSTTSTSTNAMGATGSSSMGTQAAFPSGSLVIPSPQTAGLEIAVSNITVQVPTWVVIYENYNGQPGNVLGAGLFVSGRTSGVVDLLRGTLPGQTYFAGEARDDGDHMFSMANDPAIRDANGNPIVVKFETK